MRSISIGKLRGLQQIASERGTFSVLALDHRQNLRRLNPAMSNDQELSRFKLDVASLLAPHSTAVLLDPEYSAGQAISGNVLPNNVGLVVAVESTGFTGSADARKGRIIPGWSVEKTKRMGASAVKVLVYYHPDSSTAKWIEEFVAKVAEECIKYDIALMLEPLAYPLNENGNWAEGEKHFIVMETAKRLTALGIDILKAESPLEAHDQDTGNWRRAFEEISSTSRVPWILLSAAADYEVFLRQVGAACISGASGIAVGRAVWKEAVNLGGGARLDFLRTTAQERMSRLTSLCIALARPYTDFYRTDTPLDWYQSYQAT